MALQLVTNTEEATSASIPMRWCLGRDTLAKLQAKGALNPYLLLITVNARLELVRHLVPIGQMMEYIDFRRPGPHKVLAAIVWNSQGDTKVLKKRIFGGKIVDEVGSHKFSKMNVLDEGELCINDSQYKSDHKFAVCSLDEVAQIEVSVAEEFFAAPPPKFEQFWVNFWFENTPRDQCQFRRRRMLAYTIQPLVVLPYMLGKTVVRFVAALFLLLCGKRGMNLRPLVHPWEMDNNDIWWNAGHEGYVFTTKKGGGSRQPIMIIFTPIVHVSITVGAYVATYFQQPLTFWQIVGLGEGVVVALATLFYLLVVALWLVDTIGDTVQGTAPKVAAFAAIGLVAVFVAMSVVHYPLTAVIIVVGIGATWLASRLATIETRRLEALPEDERKRILLEREYTRFQALACNGPMVARYDALPQERRTVYLRYRDFKAKVCKQFAA